MKNSLALLSIAIALAAAPLDADAARRFGGGNNIGKQRAVPTTPANATSTATAAKPATPAPAANTAPAAPVPKPSFMSRWGGLLAGLGIGALLASVFGAQMGPAMGLVLLVLAVVALGFFAMRFFAPKHEPAAAPLGFAGIGSAIEAAPPEAGVAPAASAPSALSPAEIEPFLRTAKISFIRLQAANDAKDLSDIRDYTTPEVYAEIAMQIRERGDAPQKTEVVMLDAKLVADAIEDDQAIASVHFSGLIRENDAPTPQPFDEIWHVRKNLGERNATWQIAGIQQAA
ncbi:MAG: Tim44 domain-containing protein [Usitatibacter sp.]